MFKAYIEDISGATAIEYGLIATVIAFALVSSSIAVTDSVNTMFERVNTAMN